MSSVGGFSLGKFYSLGLGLFIIIIVFPAVEAVLSGATYLNPIHLANAIIAMLCIVTGYFLLLPVAILGGLKRARRFIEGFIIFLALFFIVLAIENVVALVLIYPLPTAIKNVIASTVKIELGRETELSIPLPYVLSTLIAIGGLLCIPILQHIRTIYVKLLKLEKKGEIEVNNTLKIE